MIAEEVVEQVKESADLVAIIGESVSLRRTGADYRGACPFHGGTHRNFAVIPRKGIFYCYVCHEGGDIFTWFMKRQGLSYPDAVREVGRLTGVVVPEGASREAADPREPLYSAMALAQEYYARVLREGDEARAARRYLDDRAIPNEAAWENGLGFAPAGDGLQEAMRSLGIGEQVLLEAGLLQRREDGTVRPRFRNRLLFPIHDLRGRVVAFGGRLLGDGEPKYLNSPETDLFHKGKILYHLHAAKHAIRTAGHAILVEGYFDVLRLALTGVEQVVAPLGTGLSAEQAALLRRYTDQVILLYDSDQAGLRATFRAGDELLRHGMKVRVATIPGGDDPDLYARHRGAEGVATLLEDAVDLFERKLQLLERKGWLERLDQRREAVDRLLPTIRAAADPIVRDLYLGRLAERLGIPRETLAAELVDRHRPPPAHAVAGPMSAPPPSRRTGLGGDAVRPRVRYGAKAERRLLEVLLAEPAWRDRARDDVEVAMFRVPVLRELFQALVAVPARDGMEAVAASLSPRAGEALARLQASVAERIGLNWDAEYDGALTQLGVEAELRRYAEAPASEREAVWRGMSATARACFTFRKPARGVRPVRSPQMDPTEE